MKIFTEGLRKDAHFPINQAQPMKKISGFFNKLKRAATFKREYMLIEEYILWSDYLNAFMYFPAPFFYDIISAPKIFNWAYKSDGMLLLGALPHDFIFRYQCVILIGDEGFLYLKAMTQNEADIVLETLAAKESGLKKSVKVAKNILTLVGGFTYRAWKKQGKKVSIDFPALF